MVRQARHEGASAIGRRRRPRWCRRAARAPAPAGRRGARRAWRASRPAARPGARRRAPGLGVARS